MKKITKRRYLLWITLASIVVMIAAACAIYVSDYYRADPEAIAAFASDASITEQELDDGTLAYIPEEPAAGFIFYPGGKVEYSAYAPLMRACAAEGILCILVEMPFHLAVLDVNAADGIQQRYPQIEAWYIGGHSLGGSMAASYLAEHTKDFAGLILLGSYSTADFSNGAIAALSVYGSEDHILNREKYAEYTSNLPADFTEVVIEGGCHAYFGMYGSQDGDGVPTISNEKQIAASAAAIADFVKQ